MEPHELAWLLSDDGQAWLARLAAAGVDEHNHLTWAMRLRDAVGAQHAHALLETTLLRRRAAAKFSRADAMYFERTALEMSSAEAVALYRAQRYAGYGRVADLGCGIGGDAIGLTSVAAVMGVEIDALRLALAVENLRAYGRADRFSPLQADINTLEAQPVDALFFDPARRDAQGKRLWSLADYRPPLTVLERWRRVTPHWGVKISPGVDYGELPADATVEFISLDGDVREAVLWYGDLRGAARRATLLPSGATLSTDDPVAPVGVVVPQGYLYEPDGAVIRAHLVEHLATQLGAQQIDGTIAYLTADRILATPFARGFAIEDWLPFQLKTLRAYLRARDVGEVVIKKRGSPLEPEALRTQLRLRGTQRRVLFLTHVQGAPAVLIGHELPA